jgi:UDPglucose--hexose-1-phosphate uridylyltransferase
MSEFRQNYATKEWVIIAPERAARPHDADRHISRPVLPKHRADCPFCPGQEEETGKETYVLKVESGERRVEGEERKEPPTGPAPLSTVNCQLSTAAPLSTVNCQLSTAVPWLVRVVENRYTALNQLEEMRRTPTGLFLKAASYGKAEVVIESSWHNALLSDLPRAHILEILHAYRYRSLECGLFKNIALVMIFKNHGATAGTSLEHGHSQIIAPSIIPPHIRDPIQKAAAHYDSYGTCVYCDLVAEELRQQARIIDENRAFAAFCPFASRSPFEIRIYPKRHIASFCWTPDDELALFADILLSTLVSLRRAVGEVDYNFIIRSAPIGDEDVRYLHWYFVLIPKISTPAGFEIGSGIYINTSTPEDCAKKLRDAMA